MGEGKAGCGGTLMERMRLGDYALYIILHSEV